MELLFPLPAVVAFIIVLAAVSFLFSASETAVIGLSKIRLRNMMRKGVKGAQNIYNLVTKLDKFIAAILIGNDFMNIAISAIVTAVFVQIFGYRLGVVVSTFVSTFFVLIVCNITPKILAVKHTEKIALITAPIMEFCLTLFKPIIFIFTAAGNLLLKIFRVGAAKRSPLVTEEELRMMIEVGKEEGVLSDEERKMLQRIFEFGDTKLKDVMVPLAEMASADIRSDADSLLNIFAEEGHARLPVYSGSKENIIGVIYARDLLYILKDKGLFVLQDLMRQPYYAAASARVNELLIRFQSDKIQIAIVRDEKNRAVGLVTLEDLIEEIVGEIEEK